MNDSRPLSVRLENLSRHDPATGCTVWTGHRNEFGYGKATYQNKDWYAHRLSYTAHKGAIPDGLHVDHICHNTGCINPDHLRPATAKQNKENPDGLRSTNTSGYRGISWDRRDKRWRARVGHHGQVISVGRYLTKEEAAEAARLARLALFTHNDADHLGPTS